MRKIASILILSIACLTICAMAFAGGPTEKKQRGRSQERVTTGVDIVALSLTPLRTAGGIQTEDLCQHQRCDCGGGVCTCVSGNNQWCSVAYGGGGTCTTGVCSGGGGGGGGGCERCVYIDE